MCYGCFRPTFSRVTKRRKACGSSTKFWPKLERSVAKLSAEFAGFVHFAIRTLMLDCRRALTRPQNFVRYYPRLDERVRVLDGHLVKNFVALPGQLLDDMQVGRMKQA